MRPVLVLRPEPGNAATCRRLEALGLTAISVPLFQVRPVAWTPPPAPDFDALMLTSAQAVRQAGAHLSAYHALPVLAVGRETGAAATAAGFASVTCGEGDAAALLALAGGANRILHLCGRDHRALADPRITRVIVYASEAVDGLPASLPDRPIALLHSPRAAALFARLRPDRADAAIVAISRATADAAGVGWVSVAIAERPTDDAMLAEAARLCDECPR